MINRGLNFGGAGIEPARREIRLQQGELHEIYLRTAAADALALAKYRKLCGSASRYTIVTPVAVPPPWPPE
jgi:hypothetical protein